MRMKEGLDLSFSPIVGSLKFESGRHFLLQYLSINIHVLLGAVSHLLKQHVVDTPELLANGRPSVVTLTTATTGLLSAQWQVWGHREGTCSRSLGLAGSPAGETCAQVTDALGEAQCPRAGRGAAGGRGGLAGSRAFGLSVENAPREGRAMAGLEGGGHTQNCDGLPRARHPQLHETSQWGDSPAAFLGEDP